MHHMALPVPSCLLKDTCTYTQSLGKCIHKCASANGTEMGQQLQPHTEVTKASLLVLKGGVGLGASMEATG